MINLLNFSYFYLFAFVISTYLIFLNLLNTEINIIKWLIYITIIILIICTPLIKKYYIKYNKENIKYNYLFIIFLFLLLFSLNDFFHYNTLSFIFIINCIFLYFFNSNNKNIFNLQNITIIIFTFIIFNISTKLYYWIDFKEYLWRTDCSALHKEIIVSQ